MAQTKAHTIPRTFDQCKISHSRITAYRENYPDPISEETKKKREENLTRGKYNGYMSQKTRIKVRDYIHNWVRSFEHHFRGKREYRRKTGIDFCLVTLTLPCTQNHDDRDLKKQALKPFIQQLQRLYRVKNYFWVNEVQKNGNSHFHLIVDRSIDHRKLRDLWNGYMADLGYIQDYRDAQNHLHRNGFHCRTELLNTWSYGKQVEAYTRGINSNWSNPNSTDIKRINHVQDLAPYLSKYLTKDSGTRPVDGRLWGCSDSLRSVSPITIKLSPRLKNVLMQLAAEKGSCFFGSDFNWTLWRFNDNVLFFKYPVLAEIWQNFSRHCLRMLYPDILKDGFFQSLAIPARQSSLELVPVYS